MLTWPPQSRAESNELITYACWYSAHFLHYCVIQDALPRAAHSGQSSHWPRLSPIGQQNLSSPSLRLSFPVIIDCVNLTMKTHHQWSLPWSLEARKCYPCGMAPVWKTGACLRMPWISSTKRRWPEVEELVQLAKCLPSVQEALDSVSSMP